MPGNNIKTLAERNSIMEKNIEELILGIAQRSGKNEGEIRGLVQIKTKKFAGLLTDEGAAHLVEKELGLKGKDEEQLKISELTDGKKGVEVKGNVEAIYPVKEFEKNGKKGKLLSLILSDGTGEIRTTLWNDQVDKYKLTRGDEIILSNGIVSSYNEKKQLTLGFGGDITITKKGVNEKIKISNLKGGLNSVSTMGRIIRKFPCKEFESKDRKGKLCSFQFGDETAIVRTTAWNEKADAMDEFNEGDSIEINNAYTKEGKYGIELHLGYTAEIKQCEEKIATVMEIMKETLKEKAINQLTEGESAVIEAKVVRVLSGNLTYVVCEKCGKKTTKTENGLLCENCGEIKGKKNAVISATIEDETAQIQLTLFGESALKLIKQPMEELTKNLEEKSTETIIDEINEKIGGEKVKIYGYSRTSKFSGSTEFIAKEIIE